MKVLRFDDLHSLLQVIEQRAGMFLFPVGIQSLRSLVDGYLLAAQAHGVTELAMEYKNVRFHDWVAMKEGRSGSAIGWNSIISDSTADGEEQLKKFFRYYHEYRNRGERIIIESEIPESRQQSPWKHRANHKLEPVEPIYPPHMVQIVSYTSDEGVFIRYLDSDGIPLESERYCVSARAARDSLNADFSIRV